MEDEVDDGANENTLISYNMKKIRIIHIINADTTGGVEVGAKIAQTECSKFMDYEIRYIYDVKDSWFKKLIKLFKTAKLLLRETKEKDNQNLLSSLWMSHIVSLIVKTFSKKITWISFIHNSNYSNKLNYLVCTKLTLLADKQVFDSYSTSKAYNNNVINQTRIVNYLFQNYDLKEFDINEWSNRKYDFIIVARNTKQKGFLELEKFCLSVSNSHSFRPKFMIITNNHKKILDLEALQIKLHDVCAIDYKIDLPNSEVLRYLSESKVYFCLSHFEGFGITILESILSGCFVVTTNVGEQKNYLWPERRLIIEKANNYKIDFNYINNNGASKENFFKTKDFLFKNVKPYAESLKRIIFEES